MTDYTFKRIIFKMAVISIVSGIFFFFVTGIQAAVEPLEYTVLAPLPGTTEDPNCVGTDCKANLTSYIPGLFNLIIALSAVLAVGYIIYGGFLYITTDAIQGKQEGKAKITNAIYGLIMVSVAWLILYTINPRLLKFDLNIGTISVPERFTTVPGTLIARCINCVSITGIQVKPGAGTNIKLDTLRKLQDLNADLSSNGMTLYINEAYPPTRLHANICHQNGSCVDTKLVPDAKIKEYVDLSAQAGLKSVFEVETNQRKLEILAASCSIDQSCRNKLTSSIVVLPPKPDGTRQITGEHFSVYDCGTDPISCR